MCTTPITMARMTMMGSVMARMKIIFGEREPGEGRCGVEVGVAAVA